MIRMRSAVMLLLSGVTAACTTPVAPPPRPTPPAVPPRAPPASGIDRVMGQDAATLIALMGPPVLDAHEGPARRLQFRGAPCVLDAYLYPPQGAALYPPQGAAGPLRVTWLDARTPAGGEFDRASCIAALARH